MKALTRVLAVMGIISTALAVSGGVSRLEAQHGTCIACVLYNNAYECWSGSQIGWNSCQILYDQGCVLGAKCGYYRPAGDGTVARMEPRASGGKRVALVRVDAKTILTSGALPVRVVERGCDGAVTRRTYSTAAVHRLRSSSRAIRL